MFSIPFLINKYEGFIVATLLCETNTIFLRARLLLGFINIEKTTSIYKTVSNINLGNFRQKLCAFFIYFSLLNIFFIFSSDIRIHKNFTRFLDNG